ncbi:uncharacterized protein LOC101863153 [Aplysia californica]|uniref:Uncharacterized protein LOC101863153 n=1 Tax=Aplysia californica TaxID=6500 RepID=A0ABM0JB63_APLCA|nr:uncharacterized protein LOC101863153 [Aplysia californica]
MSFRFRSKSKQSIKSVEEQNNDQDTVIMRKRRKSNLRLLRIALKSRLRKAYEFRKQITSKFEKAMNQCIFIRIEGIILNSSGSSFRKQNKKPGRGTGAAGKMSTARKSIVRVSVKKPRTISFVDDYDEKPKQRRRKSDSIAGALNEFLSVSKKDKEEEEPKHKRHVSFPTLDEQAIELSQIVSAVTKEAEAGGRLGTSVSIWDSVKTSKGASSGRKGTPGFGDKTLGKKPRKKQRERSTSLYQLIATQEEDAEHKTARRKSRKFSMGRQKNEQSSSPNSVSSTDSRSPKGSLSKLKQVLGGKRKRSPGPSQQSRASAGSINSNNRRGRRTPSVESTDSHQQRVGLNQSESKNSRDSTDYQDCIPEENDEETSQHTPSQRETPKTETTDDENVGATSYAQAAKSLVSNIIWEKTDTESTNGASPEPGPGGTARGQNLAASRGPSDTAESQGKEAGSSYILQYLPWYTSSEQTTSAGSGRREARSDDPSEFKKATRSEHNPVSGTSTQITPQPSVQQASVAQKSKQSQLGAQQTGSGKKSSAARGRSSPLAPEQGSQDSFASVIELDSREFDRLRAMRATDKTKTKKNKNAHSSSLNDWSSSGIIIDDLCLPKYNNSDHNDEIRQLQYELWKAKEQVGALRRVNSFLKERNGHPATETKTEPVESTTSDQRATPSLLVSFIPAIVLGILTGKFVL